MTNQIRLPMDIFARELDRLTNDRDRLQMLVTLKLHLQNLQLNSTGLQMIFVRFNEEKYRLQAIEQLIPWIYTSITSESCPKLLELFHHHQNRFNLIETLKNCELLKSNHSVHEILRNEYRQYFHVKTPKEILENLSPPSIPVTAPTSIVQASSTTSGVFEKAKQFVCRVFGGVSSSTIDQPYPTKRSIEEVISPIDEFECKKFHILESDSPILISTSPSYTSLSPKSPPPSPITRQSSMSFHIDESSLPPMVTQIHSILDNIDSVLDKIEAQTQSVTRRPALNDNYSSIENPPVRGNLDQITQTNMHVNLNDGSGDTLSRYVDSVHESHSIVSSDESEEESDDDEFG